MWSLAWRRGAGVRPAVIGTARLCHHPPGMQNERLLIGRWCHALKLCSAAIVFWVLVLAAASQPVASQPLSLSAELPSMSMTATELSLLDAINDYRRTQGLAAWAAEPGLAAVARGHSQTMAQRGSLSHDGFPHRAEGTGSTLCVENLLHGSLSPTRTVWFWAASGEHRDKLLEPGARFAGIGVAGRFVTMLACASPPAKARGADTLPLNGGRR